MQSCHFNIFDHAFAALLPLRDLQFSLVLWLQPSLPLTKFKLSHLHVKWLLILTCSSNQELGSHIVKYKHMVLICLYLWTIHSEYQHILQPSICTELSTQCFTYFSQADEPFFSCFILNSFKILLTLNILTQRFIKHIYPP